MRKRFLVREKEEKIKKEKIHRIVQIKPTNTREQQHYGVQVEMNLSFIA